MGVQGLWDLLGVTGRRVEVEALGNRRVAVDASIWIVQFIKAMRQSDGSVMANAHLLGMFRRLCKLIFMKVKPVIVFDGAAPVLKRRTLQNRRRQRQKGETQLKKIAERMLLNQLRAQAMGIAKPPEGNKVSGEAPSKQFDFSNPNKPKVAQSGNAKSDGGVDDGNKAEQGPGSADRNKNPVEEDLSSPGRLNGADGEVSTASRAKTQGSLRGQLLRKRGQDKGGGQVAGSADSVAEGSMGENNGNDDEEEEEEFKNEEEEDDDDDEDNDHEEEEEDSGEEIEGLGKRVAVRLPAGAEYEEMKDQIEALPMLMQYETLQNLKEDRRATNRSVFASVRDSPDAYSQLQIKNYLKTTSINGHIEAVRAKLAGSHVMVTEDGKLVPAKRIISDDSAEFILYQKASQSASATTPSSKAVATKASAEAGSKLRSEAGGVVQGHTLSMRSVPRPEETEDTARTRNLEFLNGSESDESEVMEDVMSAPEQTTQRVERAEEGTELNEKGEDASGGGKKRLESTEGRPDQGDSNGSDDDNVEMDEVIKADDNAEEEMEDVVVVDDEGADLFAGVFEGKAGGDEDAEDVWALGEDSKTGGGGQVERSEQDENKEEKKEDEEVLDELQVHNATSDVGVAESKGKGKAKQQQSGSEETSPVNDEQEPDPTTRGSKGVMDLSEEDQIRLAMSLSLHEEQPGTSSKPSVIVSDSEDEVEREGRGGGASTRDQDIQSMRAAEAGVRKHADDAQTTCMLCDDTDTDGVLVCADCGYCGHSWCLYGSGQEEEEEEAVTRGEAWRCFSCQRGIACQGKKGGAKESSATGKGASGSKINSGDSVSAENRSGPLQLDMANVKSRKEIKRGQRLGESLEVPDTSALPDVKSDEEEVDVEERVRRALRDGRKTTVNPKKILQEAGFDYSGGMLVQKRSNSGSRGPSAHASPNPSFAAAPAKVSVPKLGADSATQPSSQSPQATKNTAARKEWDGEVKEGDRKALAELLEGEKASLAAAKQKLQKATETVTDQMMLEVQELLELFGVPYVLSPTEAEAQCAALESLQLVDGIITDDCDVFLFGGRNVFKNIFSDNKFVEWYMMESIESELCLDRDKLVMLALLLGSDYTEGIRGIGIVNAVETLRAFPSADDLREFRNWVYSVSSYDFSAACTDAALLHARRSFAKSHSKAKKNWEVSSEFPSQAVVEAYMKPTVDKSTEAFEWGEPDVAGLELFCKAKFGWEAGYTQQVLRPVLQAHRTRLVQTRVDQYSSFYKRAARIKSARVKKVVMELTRGLVDPEMMADEDGMTTEFLEGGGGRGKKSGGAKEGGKSRSKGDGAGPTKKKRKKKSKVQAEKDAEGDVNLDEEAELQAALRLSMQSDERGAAAGEGPSERGAAPAMTDDVEDADDLEDDAEFQAALQLSATQDVDDTERHKSEVTETAVKGAKSKRGVKRAKSAASGASKRRKGKGAASQFVDDSDDDEWMDEPEDAGERQEYACEVHADKTAVDDDAQDEEWELDDDFQAALAMSKGKV